MITLSAGLAVIALYALANVVVGLGSAITAAAADYRCGTA